MFLDWAKATLSGFDSLNEALGVEKQEFVGLLKVATNEYNGHLYLTEALMHFRRIYPRLHFQATITDDPLALLNQGYDLAIHSGEPPAGRSSGEARHVTGEFSRKSSISGGSRHSHETRRPARPQLSWPFTVTDDAMVLPIVVRPYPRELGRSYSSRGQ